MTRKDVSIQAINMMQTFIIILQLITLVCSAGITTKGDLTVLYGQDAVFSCSIPDAAGVKQVTWLRASDDKSVRTLVTFSERFKTEVSESYVGKLNVTLASLNAINVVMKNVTYEDEDCYICSFSVYPSGTTRRKQCLTVQGLSETTASVALYTETDVIVTCSATGKSTPVINWWLEDQELIHYSTRSTVQNHDDGANTVISNLTLPLSEFQGQYVKCVAAVGSMENNELVHLQGRTKMTVTDSYRYYVSSVVAVAIFVASCSCVTIALHRRRKRQSKEMVTEII